jgi:hypothetical protein
MWWFSAVTMLLVALVVYVASALQVLSFGPVADQRREVAAEERAAEPESSLLGREATGGTIRIPGAPAPRDAADQLPIPPGARVVEESAHGERGDFSIRLVLDAPGDAADVLAFYREELPARGWEEVLMWRWRSEATAVPTGELSTFCRGAAGPRFVVAAAPSSPARSRVHIRIDSATPGPCAVSPPGGAPPLERDAPVPML